VRYQARPKWDLERSLRRRAFTRLTFYVLGGMGLVVIGYSFLLLLFAALG
jgi:hypothetical protein